MDSLARVKRATSHRSRTEQEWREAVKQAVAGGWSHRAVAAAAGISHTRVQQILRDQ